MTFLKILCHPWVASIYKMFIEIFNFLKHLAVKLENSTKYL